jgi:hypothetical protein
MALGTRAVRRLIASGENAFCAGCDQWIKYQASKRLWRIISNVYVDGEWDRTEVWHESCYLAAEEPYGPPVNSSR